MDRRVLHEPLRPPWRMALNSSSQVPQGLLNGPLDGPLRPARAVEPSVQVALSRDPEAKLREPPRDHKRSVVSSTVRLTCRPGHLQLRPQLLSWGYFRPC